MNEIISLIWLTHPTALNDVITAAREENPDDADAELSTLLAALMVDDTFNDYTEEQLAAAIAEAINEY